MAKFAKQINAFVAGEMSPRMYGRTDADQYGQGARELTNHFIRTQGGVWRRPGTIYISDGIVDSNGTTTLPFSGLDQYGNQANFFRLIPFKFSRTDSSVVLLTNMSPYVYVYLPATDQWTPVTLALSSAYVAFSGWATQAELDAVQFAQSGDVLVMVSGKNPPVFLARTSTTAYALKDIYSLRDLFPATRTPYTGSNTTVQAQVSPSTPPIGLPFYNVPYTLISYQGTASVSATTGAVTITTTSFDLSKYPGTILRVTKNGVTGFIILGTATGVTNQVNGSVIKALGQSGVQDSFEIQTWNQVSGWPTAVAFHDQRLVYGGTASFPNTLWGSQVGDFTELMITRPADDINFQNLSNDRPYSYNLASTVVNKIAWLLSAKSSLFIGTLGDEWIAESTQDNIVGPLNPNFSNETSYGSKAMQAIAYNGSVIFCDRSGQHFRELQYNRSVDNYRAIDLNYYAEHLLRKGQALFPTYNPPEIKNVAVQQGNQNSIYALDSNGLLHVLAKENDYGVLGWSSLQFGGTSDALGSPPIVRGVCVVPSITGTDEETYVLIERLIRGAKAIYLEKIAGEFVKSSLAVNSAKIEDQAVYSDSAILVTQLPAATFLARYRATDTVSANVALGAAAPTATVGAPVIDANGLNLTGTTPRNVTYDALNAPMLQKGTIYFDFRPNYSGTPTADQHFFAISASSASNANLISVVHRASNGYLVLEIRDATGAVMYSNGFLDFNEVFGSAWSPTAGQNYRFTISYDTTPQLGGLAPGFIRTYLNGRQRVGSGVAIPNATRTAPGQLVLGSDYTKTKNLNGWLKNFTLSPEAPDLPTVHRHAFGVGNVIVGTHNIDGAGQVLGDGQYLGTIDPTAGTLQTPIAARGVFGYAYTSRVKTMDLEAGSILGGAQGEMARVHEATIRFERTVGARYGTTIGQLDDINFQEFTTQTGPIPLFTGDKTLKVQPGHRRERVLVIEQNLPMPCNITALFARGQTVDG